MTPFAAKAKMKKHVRNKWWKFVTLVNNPGLVMDEMSKRVKEQGHRGLAAVSNRPIYSDKLDYRK